MSEKRLQKILSESGLLSRRKAEEAILAGRVSVNGQIITELGSKANWEKDQIHLDGKPVLPPPSPLIVLFHKPKQVVTTKSDPQGRKTVMEFVSHLPPLNPVGRLDYETTGLLIFTNHGELAHQLTHPSFGVEKTYEVTLSNPLSEKAASQLIDGVLLEDGEGVFLNLIALNPKKDEFRITVGEGRNRFVRRMLEAVGSPVLELKRTEMGPFHLGDLEPGQVHVLPEEEVKEVLSLVES